MGHHVRVGQGLAEVRAYALLLLLLLVEGIHVGMIRHPTRLLVELRLRLHVMVLHVHACLICMDHRRPVIAPLHWIELDMTIQFVIQTWVSIRHAILCHEMG